MKTNELTGAQLDWAVAKCEGIRVRYQPGFLTYSEIQVLADWDNALEYTPSTDWAQGGPIIERGGIAIRKYGEFPETLWQADDWQFRFVNPKASGPTPLVAAMRCYVALKMGDEIEIPKELA